MPSPRWQFGLLPGDADQARAALHGAQAIARSGLEVGKGAGTMIGELVLLDLDRTVGRFQVFAHQRAAVRREAVPNHQQRFADLVPERVQELDDLRPLYQVSEPVVAPDQPPCDLAQHGTIAAGQRAAQITRPP